MRSFGKPGTLLARAAATLAVAVVAGGCSSAPAPAPTAAQPQALAPGDYRSSVFQPVVSYTLPAGWTISDESATFYGLRPVTSDVLGIYLFRSPGAASQQPDCPTTSIPDVGPMANDLVTWIEGLPGVDAGPRRSVQLGGLLGLELDVAITSGWAISCPFADGLPTVPLLVGANGLRWVLAGSERLRLTVLDVPSGGTVVVDVDDFDGSQLDGFLRIADPIVRSMRFTPS